MCEAVRRGPLSRFCEQQGRPAHLTLGLPSFDLSASLKDLSSGFGTPGCFQFWHSPVESVQVKHPRLCRTQSLAMFLLEHRGTCICRGQPCNRFVLSARVSQPHASETQLQSHGLWQAKLLLSGLYPLHLLLVSVSSAFQSVQVPAICLRLSTAHAGNSSFTSR